MGCTQAKTTQAKPTQAAKRSDMVAKQTLKQKGGKTLLHAETLPVKSKQDSGLTSQATEVSVEPSIAVLPADASGERQAPVVGDLMPEHAAAIGWACSACTFANSAARSSCELCETARPVVSAVEASVANAVATTAPDAFLKSEFIDKDPTSVQAEPSAAGGEPLVDAFDTADAVWQASDEFSPDKESSWAHPAEKDGWMLAHNAIRGEIADIKGAISEVVERGAVEQWEIAAIRAVWSEHSVHVHSHHSNEDDEFSPFLAGRINLPAKLEADHTELVRQMDHIEQLVESLSTSSDHHAHRRKAYGAELQAAWATYEALMLPHLAEEERICLPLMRAYFTPQEVSPIVQKIVAKGPAVEMGSFIHYAGDQAFFDFMKQEGIPGFVWYIDFKSKRDHFQKVMMQHIQALIAGTPPVPAKSLFGC